MKSIPKVVLLVETSRGYGRQILRGIVRYSRLHGPWSFYITPGDFVQRWPEIQQWGATGIVARIETVKLAEAIEASGLPTIALDMPVKFSSPDTPPKRFSDVRPDPKRITELGAAHLLERGFQRFAYCGTGDIWSVQRQEGFTAALGKAGFDCEVYPLPRRRRDRVWDREQASLAAWIRDLPKPVGVMACNDDRGRQVLEACLAAGVDVPREVAVLGVDNDDLLCDLCDPPMSSVAINGEWGGFEAAKLLDRLMRRRNSRPGRIVVPPTHVVTRRSTDVLAMEDRDVAAALAFIRDSVGQPIQVQDVLQHVPLSRRALEMRFRRALGRSVHDEIQRVRLDRARQLLIETDFTTPKIAEMSGFGSASYLGVMFSRATGMTPTKFRKHVRSR
jgi:LacI family transcriptional regulator